MLVKKQEPGELSPPRAGCLLAPEQSSAGSQGGEPAVHSLVTHAVTPLLSRLKKDLEETSFLVMERA